jgi:hypothetical protein
MKKSSRWVDACLIEITPNPIFFRFVRHDQSMLGGFEVFAGVLVLRVVAATHMPANQANTKVDPPIANFQTVFATFRAWSNSIDQRKVTTLF